MKNYLLVSILCFVFALSNCSSQGLKDIKTGNNKLKRTVYFSLVQKDENSIAYLHRLPTADNLILLTKQPVAETRDSAEVTESEGESLFLVELLTTSPVKGEKLRFHGYAVISREEGISTSDPEHPSYSKKYFYLGPIGRHEISFVEPEPFSYTYEQTSYDLGLGLDISAEYLKKKASELSGAEAVTIDGQEVKIRERSSQTGKNQALQYLINEFKKFGFNANKVPYTFKDPIFEDDPDMGDVYKGTNLVVEKAGTDNTKMLIIGAHYDSAGTPGADDNGSGTVSLLALADALKNINLKVKLRLVAFDQEESGLIGSSGYVKQLTDNGELNSLVGVFNLDMVGYDKNSDNKFTISDCNENTSGDLTKILLATVKKYNMPLQRLDNCSSASDHSSFWESGKPAVMLIEDMNSDFNSCYHQSCDQVNIMNFTYHAKVVTLVAKTVADYFGGK